MKIQRRWRGVFDASNKFVGIVELVGEKWHAYGPGGRLIGFAATSEEAAALIEQQQSVASDPQHP